VVRLPVGASALFAAANASVAGSGAAATPFTGSGILSGGSILPVNLLNNAAALSVTVLPNSKAAAPASFPPTTIPLSAWLALCSSAALAAITACASVNETADPASTRPAPYPSPTAEGTANGRGSPHLLRARFQGDPSGSIHAPAVSQLAPVFSSVHLPDASEKYTRDPFSHLYMPFLSLTTPLVLSQKKVTPSSVNNFLSVLGGGVFLFFTSGTR
jgi:hypothetical protein